MKNLIQSYYIGLQNKTWTYWRTKQIKNSKSISKLHIFKSYALNHNIPYSNKNSSIYPTCLNTYRKYIKFILDIPLKLNHTGFCNYFVYFDLELYLHLFVSLANEVKSTYTFFVNNLYLSKVRISRYRNNKYM